MGIMGMLVTLSGWAADRYVWTGAPASGFPYTNWATAATNVHDAVAAAVGGETVWVTNGTYAVTNQILLNTGVILKSINGRDVTVLRRTGASEYRILWLNHTDAVVDGFTLTNGIGRADVAGGSAYGGGARLSAGTVKNCRMIGNIAQAGLEGESPHSGVGYGGGVYLAAGWLENCEVFNNIARGSGGSSSAAGGGIENVAGTIISCTITGNYAYGTGNGAGHAGGVQIVGSGTLRDSLVFGNRASGANNTPPSYGGGVYLSGAGLVSNCTIVANQLTWWESLGGGIYMTAGLVTHCTIISNRAQTGFSYSTQATPSGGGVYMTGGTLRNSVVAQNRVIQTGQIRPAATRGAGLAVLGGRVEHCTITRNWGDRWGIGDGVYQTAGEVVNSIAYYNFNDGVTNFTADHENLFQSGGVFGFSCTTNARGLSGVGNVSGDPGFADRFANNFRLLPGSSALDVGTNIASIATDLDGNARSRDGNGDTVVAPDLGAYEASPVNEGSFRVNFRASPEESIGATSVVFTAFIAGADTSSPVFYWDYIGDAGVDDFGANRRVITGSYGTAGYYRVTLSVTNGGGVGASVRKTAGVRVFPTMVYVAPEGIGAFPYDTPDKATTNLQAAIDAAAPGTMVLATNGIYPVTTPVILRRAVMLSSASGADLTAIERRAGNNTRLLVVMHPGAQVARFTLRNGSWQNSGMAYGGAAWMTAGMIRDCIISNNLAGGLPNQPGLGGGVYQEGGTLRNCVLFRNRCQSANSTANGGGIALIGGLVENCTVVSNMAQGFLGSAVTADTSRGGGIHRTAGGVTNTLVVFNGVRNPDAVTAIQISGTNQVGYSCSPDLVGGIDGNIEIAPQFVNGGGGDLRLERNSAGLDQGITLSWMANAMDLAGRGRIQNRLVDMGAYEREPSSAGIIIRAW